MPNFASPQLMTMTTCESTSAATPSGHQRAGSHAASTTSTAASSHTTPSGFEMGCVSASSFASPKAFTKPIR